MQIASAGSIALDRPPEDVCHSSAQIKGQPIIEPVRSIPTADAIVTLFPTCVIDQFTPEVGLAAANLIEAAGYRVEVPDSGWCCGQPALSAGFRDDARRVGRSTIEVLADRDLIVVPSGSCAAMIRLTYPKLFTGDPLEATVNRVAAKTWELSEFLALRPLPFEEGLERPRDFVTVHDSCHGLRGLGLKTATRTLLAAAGYRVREMEDPEVCCGFGGVFSALEPEVSVAMADSKLAMAETAATCITGTDAACLMHLEGRALATRDSPPRIVHLAILLDEALPGGGLDVR